MDSIFQINGINERSNIIKKENFPKLEPDEFKHQVNIAKLIFPNIKINEQWNLIDRAGLMDDVMESKLSGGNVVGCSTKRDTEWLHVSPKGEVFLCCNDYLYHYDISSRFCDE